MKIQEIRDYMDVNSTDIMIGDYHNGNFTIGFEGDNQYKFDSCDGNIITVGFDDEYNQIYLGYRNVNSEVAEKIRRMYPFGEFPEFAFTSLESADYQIYSFVMQFKKLMELN